MWFFSLSARLLVLCHIYLILLGIRILDEGEQLKEGGGAAYSGPEIQKGTSDVK